MTENLYRVLDLLNEASELLRSTDPESSALAALDDARDNLLDDIAVEVDCDDSDDGYALASAGFGTDEDYGYAGEEY